jgi:hypothetical protein
MQQMHSSTLFDAAFRGLDGTPMAAPWDMQLWWNRPVQRQPRPSLHSPGQLAMHFWGSTKAEPSVVVFLDISTTNVFLSRLFCLQAMTPVA